MNPPGVWEETNDSQKSSNHGCRLLAAGIKNWVEGMVLSLHLRLKPTTMVWTKKSYGCGRVAGRSSKYGAAEMNPDCSTS